MDISDVYVIAEAGVNHNGKKELALRLIDKAASARSDAVKFQTFKTDKLVSGLAAQAEYQIKNTGKPQTQYEMLRALELPYGDFVELSKYCEKQGIEFLSTAFDDESLRFLIDECGIKKIKISSGDIHNVSLLTVAARSNLPIILSTGMSTMEDISLAMQLLASVYKGNNHPKFSDLSPSLLTEAKCLLSKKVTLLHCTTEYPAPPEDINLLALKAMREYSGLPVGLSDHSEGIIAAIGAAALGVSIIEKHFTLDRTMKGPDHKASLNPDELAEMIRSIRLVTRMLGSSNKQISPSEIKNIHVARKSLHSVLKINEGESFSEDNLGIKRPGSGISPLYYWDIIGTRAKKAYDCDQLISEKEMTDR
ncbi:MAG: N-acetylneuraminate synthase [Oligoflexales bacterium]|nr:N-acetylneuraminate synthase [Oligoflexales bacterium]